MTLASSLEVASAVILSLGGGGVIVFGMSSWLGKVWAERILNAEKNKYAADLEELKNRLGTTTESYRVKLKKSEFLFAKEFEAASALVALVRDISPQISRPEMDWFDACEEIAMNFTAIEQHLHSYLRQYGAILPDEVRIDITACYGLASVNKFDDGSVEVANSANKAAGALLESLRAAEAKMINRVRSQTSL